MKYFSKEFDHHSKMRKILKESYEEDNDLFFDAMSKHMLDLQMYRLANKFSLKFCCAWVLRKLLRGVK